MENNIVKKELRRQMSKKRNELTEDEINDGSYAIFKRLTELNLLNPNTNVLTYVNYRSEVSTKFLIDYCISKKIKVYTPRVEDEDMNFYKISSYDELQSGAYGILEPITNEKYVPSQICNDISGNKTKDIIIIPGLVFDIKGNRIGYGGGYYDRYLLEHKNLIKCAVCYDFQIVDEGIIPYGKYDVKVDAIVTDKRLV